MSEDRKLARDYMRPVLALYVGGMGSRKQNFYKALMERYGFGDAAAKVQDLFLAGQPAEACAALPDELIDMVSLCGPPAVVAERIAAFREAGVGTLIVAPSRGDAGGAPEQVQKLAELAA